MSDQRLRTLERRWKKTGAVQDEAAWLRARVQAGELEQTRLKLAARLGHTAARLAAHRAKPLPQSVSGWFEGFARGGGDCRVAALVLAGLVLEALPRHADADRMYTNECEASDFEPMGGARAFESGGEGPQLQVVARARRLRCIPAAFRLRYLRKVGAVANRHAGGWKLVRPRLASEMASWALGYSDPVRERLEARRQEAAGE